LIGVVAVTSSVTVERRTIMDRCPSTASEAALVSYNG